MATIYPATISPSKAEALGALVQARGWGDPGGQLTVVGSYRFDDPAGEVGLETSVVRVGDALVQIPLTYRGAPLAGAEAGLVTTMQHSVLGERWIYDACCDPVYAQALVAAILTGAVGAEFVVHHDDGRREVRSQTVEVVGSGTPGADVPDIDAVTYEGGGATSTIRAPDAPGLRIVVVHDLTTPVVADGPALVGRWADSGAARPLAYLPSS